MFTVKCFHQSAVPDVISQWGISWVKLKKPQSIIGSKVKSVLKNYFLCHPDATPCTFSTQIQMFPHADTIATFQFQLNLKAPISTAVEVIEIWNPAYIQAITENTRLQLLSLRSGKVRGERNNRDQLWLKHISVYLLFNNAELAPDPQDQLSLNYLQEKMAALLNQGEIKQNP